MLSFQSCQRENRFNVFASRDKISGRSFYLKQLVNYLQISDMPYRAGDIEM